MDTPLLDYAERQIQKDRDAVNSKRFTNARVHNGGLESCAKCGAPTLEYKHTLSKVLAGDLIRLYEYQRSREFLAVMLADLRLNYSQASNFQKLRYWGLVEHRTKEDKRTGHWSITEKGEDWLRSLIRLPRCVWTYRGEVIEFEGDKILITDTMPDYKWRIDWAQDSRPHFRNEAA